MEEDMGDMPRTGSIITTNASAPLYDRWSEMMTRLQLWVEVRCFTCFLRFYVFRTCFVGLVVQHVSLGDLSDCSISQPASFDFVFVDCLCVRFLK